MKAFFDKIRKDKYKKASLTATDALASEPGPGPATSTSAMMASATNPMASVSDGSATARGKVSQTTGVTVSLRLGPSHRSCWYNYSIAVINQTAQLEAPASVSTRVAHVEEHNPSVSRYSDIFKLFTDDKQTRDSQVVPANSATVSVPITQAAGITVSST